MQIRQLLQQLNFRMELATDNAVYVSKRVKEELREQDRRGPGQLPGEPMDIDGERRCCCCTACLTAHTYLVGNAH